MRLSHLSFILLLIIFSITAKASMSERIEQAYSDLNSKTRVWCEYFGNMQGEHLRELDTVVTKGRSIITSYQAKNNRFKVMVSLDRKGRDSVELVADGLRVSGKLNRDNRVKFNFRGIDYNDSIAKGVLNLSCALEIAVEDTVDIADEVHINVHPHQNYDYGAKTTEKVLELIDIFPSISLLDDYNRKAEGYDVAKFLTNNQNQFGVKKFNDPTFEIPSSVPILVAPAGHIKYNMNRDVTTIHYTGGNHNYCIWNNTRRFINAFFRSQTATEINFIYYTNGIVNQIGGIIRGLSIPRGIFYQSNLLADIFSNMSSSQKRKYHNSYRDFFIDDLSRYKSKFFKTLTIRYQNSVHRIKGSGKIDREINFVYK